jgi:hypothetical protein
MVYDEGTQDITEEPIDEDKGSNPPCPVDCRTCTIDCFLDKQGHK